jgi:hypothetical protein
MSSTAPIQLPQALAESITDERVHDNAINIVMNESAEDRLIEEWHELAKAVDVGAPVDLSSAAGVLENVLRVFAPTLKGPTKRDEVLRCIATIRQLEKSWNQRLGNTLIDAGEAKKRNDLEAALAALDQFAEQCPWSPFSKIALEQRANYAAGN